MMRETPTRHPNTTAVWFIHAVLPAVPTLQSTAARGGDDTDAKGKTDTSKNDKSITYPNPKEHEVSLEDLTTYLSHNSTCRILFFNDYAYRPDVLGTKANEDAAQAIIFEEIPWAIVDLNVCKF